MKYNTFHVSLHHHKVPFPKTRFFYRSLLYNGFKIWNGFPQHIRMIKFKKKFRLHIIFFFSQSQDVTRLICKLIALNFRDMPKT